MSARGALPLSLLMLAWTMAARVHCQTLEASLVSTQYVEITWRRELQWFGVNEFEVRFSSEGNSDCHKSVTCSTPTCSFNSSICGQYQPCTPINITVSGDDYNAPTLVLVTGPEKVTNVALRLEEGVQYISWVNPSNDSSPCFQQTAVRISFNDEISTDYIGHGTESTSKALCVSGYGEVEVWTEGGDGHSISSWGTIVYNGSDVVDLVTFGTCEAAGCTSLAVNWSYNPVCPDVAYFSITLTDDSSELQDRSTADFSFDVPNNATSTTVTGLGNDRYYYTCISAMNKDGEELAYSCHSWCITPHVVPQSLTVQPFSDSTLRATWEPPVCEPEPRAEYKLWTTIDYEVRYMYTFDTTYNVGDLNSFHLYTLKLQVNGYGHGNDMSLTLVEEEYTKLAAPDVYTPSVHRSAVEVNWYHRDYWEYSIYFKVTWGRNLQFYGQTTNNWFVINGFDNLDEVGQVCVAAAFGGRADLTSKTDCRPVNGSSVSGVEGWVIAVTVVLVCLLVVVIVAVVVYKRSNSKVQSGRRQQQQEDEPPPYMYAIDNSGTYL